MSEHIYDDRCGGWRGAVPAGDAKETRVPVTRRADSAMSTALVWFDQARQALAKAKTVDEVKEIRDKAEALRIYTRQAGEGLEMQNWCAEIKLRAERRAGGAPAGDGEA